MVQFVQFYTFNLRTKIGLLVFSNVTKLVLLVTVKKELVQNGLFYNNFTLQFYLFYS